MIELLAVIFTILSVYLTIKNNVLCWLLSIIGSTMYFFIFQDSKDYGNMSLQMVFIAQSILGWIKWNMPDHRLISIYDNKWWIVKISSITGVLSIIIYIISHSFLGKDLILDSISTSLSLIATWLMINKKIESWIIWIAADTLLVLLFINNKHYLSSLLYLILLFMSIAGLKNWKKEYVSQGKNN